MEQHIRVACKFDHGGAGRCVAGEGEHLAFGLEPYTKAFADLSRNMFDIIAPDFDVLVFVNETGGYLADIGAHGFKVSLAQRIGAAGAEIGIERAAFEQAVAEMLRAFGAEYDGRVVAVPHPAGDREKRKVADMVVMQMCQEDGLHIDRACIGRDHVAHGACAAVEHVAYAVIEGDENAGLCPVRVGEGGACAKHGDVHDRFP